MEHAADLGGWTRFVAMENQYNLLKREEEREMLPMCADMGVGCVPYSPLGKGRLARPWGATSQRGDVDQVAKSFDLDIDQPVVQAVQQVAEERGLPMSHIAMAWVLSRPVVTAPIVGTTKPHHLADADAAVDVTLTRRRGSPARGAVHHPARLLVVTPAELAFMTPPGNPDHLPSRLRARV